MPDRYFLESPLQGDRATLTGPEAHHLTHVMRAAVGDCVVLFDGRGGEFTARIDKLGKDRAELAIVERKEAVHAISRPLILGVSLPKGDRQKWMVEKAVELGVATLIPLITARGVAQPVESALARLRRQVIEATKQCGRSRLMAIGEGITLAEFCKAAPADAARWLAHPGHGTAGREADPTRFMKSDVISAAGSAPSTWCAIGPEGGFTDDEVRGASEAHWRLVSLGAYTLRVETAAITLAAWCA